MSRSSEPGPSDPGRTRNLMGRKSTPMLGWLGFFLLVFAVAGLAFHLTGKPEKSDDSASPPEITRETR